MFRGNAYKYEAIELHCRCADVDAWKYVGMEQRR